MSTTSKYFYMNCDFPFRKGEIINVLGRGQKAKVIKYIKSTWWRKLLIKLGFKINLNWKCKIL